MDQLELVNVPVKVWGTTSPERYATIEAELRATLDLAGLIRGAVTFGGSWLDNAMSGMDGTFGDVYARVQLEGGKVTLRALGGKAVVGRPLQTFALFVDDGLVTGIRGGGELGK